LCNPNTNLSIYKKEEERVVNMEIGSFDIEVDTPEEQIIECANCKCDKAKNRCDQCRKYFCTECELKMHGESVLEFFKSYNFLNYITQHTYKLSKK
jgi:hypothetical protein